MEFRDLGAQYRALKPQIDAAIAEVLASGRFVGGAYVRELEERLADYVGVRHCITCANGTDALQLALMAWGIGSGDAVFVPDFTFFSSGEVVAAVGATPVFVDVDERTFYIDPMKLERAIYAVEADGRLHPRAVMAVDLFGLPASYPVICRICDDHGLLLLEDGAQGFRSSWAQYTVQLPGGVDRDAVQSALKERGVPIMVYYPKPLHEQPAFAGMCEVPVACSVSERLCKRVLSLPMGPYMERGDVQAVADALLAVLASELPRAFMDEQGGRG